MTNSSGKVGHTNGEWAVQEGDVIASLNPGYTVICSMRNNGIETEANAALIAAAPSLLLACKLAYKAWPLNAPEEPYKALKQAIQAAEGRG